MLAGRRGVAAVFLTVSAVLMAQSSWGQSCVNLTDLRVRFMEHGTYKQAIESEEAALRASKTASPECAVYCEAHQWVSYTRAADFGWNMAERYSRFKKGMAKLDSLVNTAPNDAVLRSLRLSVSGTAPRFLGEDTHWEADAKAVVQVSQTNFWEASPEFSKWISDLSADILQQLDTTP
jgi:hypothetical protein